MSTNWARLERLSRRDLDMVALPGVLQQASSDLLFSAVTQIAQFNCALQKNKPGLEWCGGGMS